MKTLFKITTGFIEFVLVFVASLFFAVGISICPDADGEF
jgi:hypothetical protein